MKNFLRKILFLGVLLLSLGVDAQVVLYQQNFDAGIPANMTRYNTDGLTPNAAVSFVNNSWVARENPDQVGDSVICSTSWYTPAGTSNDWIVLPAITLGAAPYIRFDAKAQDPAYPDGYQVRIATTNTQAGMNASAVALTVAAENSTWTSRNVNLSTWANQTVFIAIRNNSTDMFLLYLDSIIVYNAVNYDAQLDSFAFPSRYTMMPKAQVQPLNFSGRITNGGASALTNVRYQVDVFRNNFATNVYTGNSASVASLAAGATSAMLSGGSYTPNDTGVYIVRYLAKHNNVDDLTSNDTLFDVFVVDDSSYARDYAVVSGALDGTLGIGAGLAERGILSLKYQIFNPTKMTSADAYFDQPTAGDQIKYILYNATATGVPTTAIDSTAYYTFTTNDETNGVFLNLPFISKPTLAAGYYSLGVLEGDSNMTIGYNFDIYSPNTNYVRWNSNAGGAWTDAGPLGFPVSYILRPNLNSNCPTLTAQQLAAANCGTASGSANVTLSSGTATSYTWSNGGTSSTISNVAAGTYNVTVTSPGGCTATATATVNGTPAVVANASPTATSCGLANGSATANTTSGNGPFTYNWNNGASSQTISNVAAATYSVTVTGAGGCTATASATINSSTGITANATSTNSTCGGSTGSATANITAGTGPFNYSWSNGGSTQTISGLGSGSYTVTVTATNGGCTATATASVNNSNGPSLTTGAVNNVSCPGGNNGSASINVSGGTPGYTITWSNGQSGVNLTSVTAGNYSVTVTDNSGCQAFQTVTIGTTPGITVNPSSVAPSCFGAPTGSAILNATGGNGNLTYLWSNGATTANLSNVSGGNYSVTVNDASGCTSSFNINIPSPSQIVVNGNATPVGCNGGNNGSVTAAATGGTGTLTYNWSNGTNTAANPNLAAGSYTVTVTDANACSVSASFTVTQPTVLSSTTTSTPANQGQNNGSATVNATGGSAPYTYSWSNGGNTMTISNVAAGNYTVTVSDASGCTSTATVSVSVIGSVESLEVLNVIIYPNPNKGTFVVSAKGNELSSVRVSDLTGKIVYSNFNPVSNQEIKLGNVAAGIYFVEVKTAKGTGTKKITIE